MLRARTILRKGATLTAGGITATALGATSYAYTEIGAGFKREVTFWSKVFPVVADYYLSTAKRSPLVQYQKLTGTGLYDTPNDSHHEDGTRIRVNEEEYYKMNRKLLLQSLHEKHAPEIFETMLALKGMYIKLGQVLSVTALPLPETYRTLFRTLQSNVPGHEDFDSIVKPTLEKELGVDSLDQFFEYVEPIPCGAASIGQAHKARLKESILVNNERIDFADDERDVIIKVQYPDAIWQVPADIQCIGDLLQICVWTGVVDGDSATMSFEEVSRQFLSELEYDLERSNLNTVHESSLDPSAPYIKNKVVVPKVYHELCSNKIITMSYLPGPTMELEAKRQLEMLGIDTSGGIAQIIRDAAKKAAENPSNESPTELVRRVTHKSDLDESKGKSHQHSRRSHQLKSRRLSASKFFGNILGVDSILWTIRLMKRMYLLSQAALVKSLGVVPKGWISTGLQEWKESHETASLQAYRLGQIESWCSALFDVHGHQVFQLGLFNADPHPGNILLVEGKSADKKGRRVEPMVGLIDYGQCKKLTPNEQVKIARLILNVANEESDEVIAKSFRDLEIKTKNDSTEFLAQFGRLMFGSFQPEHLSHDWHQNLHSMDRVLYFPKELSMVYRTALLLRGLAISLQLNYSIGEQWKSHAKEALDRIEKSSSSMKRMQ